jgi:phage baseplate assembly protein V
VLPGFNRSNQGTSGVGMPELTDSGRRIHNAIRYGVVAEADYEAGEIRVDLQDGELRTDWLPWITLRAGADLFWWAPEVGEVVILLAPSGELANGVAIPAAFSNGRKPASRETVQRAVFADGAVSEYDRERHRHLLDLTGVEDSEVWIRCQKRVFVNAVGPDARVLIRADGADGEIRFEAASIVFAPPPGVEEVAVTGSTGAPLIVQAERIHLNPGIGLSVPDSGGWLPDITDLDIPDGLDIPGLPSIPEIPSIPEVPSPPSFPDPPDLELD